MLRISQTTWIVTFLEGVTDTSTELPQCSDLAWFANKVSGIMSSTSVCDHCWSIERWIHSQRSDLVPWDIEVVIDEPVDEQEEEQEVYVWIETTDHSGSGVTLVVDILYGRGGDVVAALGNGAQPQK
jgi:hypothetical protein